MHPCHGREYQNPKQREALGFKISRVVTHRGISNIDPTFNHLMETGWLTRNCIGTGRRIVCIQVTLEIQVRKTGFRLCAIAAILTPDRQAPISARARGLRYLSLESAIPFVAVHWSCASHSDGLVNEFARGGKVNEEIRMIKVFYRNPILSCLIPPAGE